MSILPKLTRDEHLRAQGALNALDAIHPKMAKLKADRDALLEKSKALLVARQKPLFEVVGKHPGGWDLNAEGAAVYELEQTIAAAEKES